MYELHDRVAIVTGAGKGIGYAVSARLLEEGASVVMVDLDGPLLDQAVGSMSAQDRVGSVAGDVAAATTAERAVQAAKDRFGVPEILVNNAGLWIIKDYLDSSADDLERQLAVNLVGTDRFMTATLPGMIDLGRGSIVNISSVAAMHFTVPHAGYAASKAAVNALTRDVAYEVGKYGVRANCIAPGLIFPDQPGGPSARQPTAAHPLGEGRPTDIANVTAFLASDQASFVTGVTIPVCGGADLWISMSFDASVQTRGVERAGASDVDGSSAKFAVVRTDGST